MKRYKLIKEYPGSPALRTVVKLINGFYTTDETKLGGYGIKLIENYPEFWKELKYLFTTTDGVDIYEGEKSVLVDKKTLEIRDPECNIGNNFSNFYYFSTTDTAKKFVKEQKKEPLLVTSDGYNLYEGDLYYNVYFKEYKDLFTVLGPWKVEIYDEHSFWSNHSAFFFLKENAEKYIEENKPKYSHLDLFECCAWVTGYDSTKVDLVNIWVENHKNK